MKSLGLRILTCLCILGAIQQTQLLTQYSSVISKEEDEPQEPAAVVRSSQESTIVRTDAANTWTVTAGAGGTSSGEDDATYYTTKRTNSSSQPAAEETHHHASMARTHATHPRLIIHAGPHKVNESTHSKIWSCISSFTTVANCLLFFSDDSFCQRLEARVFNKQCFS